jgi:hypothetical protein
LPLARPTTAAYGDELTGGCDARPKLRPPGPRVATGETDPRERLLAEVTDVSVFRVIQWSVNPPDREACEQAVRAVADHVKSVHPAAQSFRTCCESFAPLRRWTYMAIFEFESVTAWDNDQDTPSCEEVWAPIHQLAQTGSFAMSFWADPQQESAPDARLRAGSSEETGAPGVVGGELRR